MTIKRPRQYAAEIIVITTAAGRRKALAKVPEVHRAATEHYVRDHFARTKAARHRG